MVNELYDPIAIVGLAGRFPGAPDVNEFWLNLCAGRESVHYPADEELLAASVPAASLRDPNYIKAVALAPDIDRFDAEFFGLTPKEAALCDPQIKLFLETAHAAMENAGYDPHRVVDVGVFGSAGVNRYVDQHINAASGTMRSATGMSLGVLSNSDYVATLVSYKYNFRGPSMTVQTACSSSMVAVHLAAGALRNGECSIALAGGADVEFPFGHGHWWAPGSPLTRDGHCRPFDSRATGTIFSSGAGVVVLKRLSDALADGDQIRAVLRSMAVNNDGSDKVGFSAPGVSGQAAVITEAMAVGGIRPDQVSLVEAHSTGTVLGDPVEVAALNQAYRGLAGTDFVPGACHLGSVKGNVGHLGHAAGVTSLIKVVLALENERIPPSINFEEPNPKIEFDGSPFAVVTRLRPWPRVPGRPRLAGVNSLGIGGTNVHAVVQEAPERTPSAGVDGRPRLVIWSARSQAAVRAYEEKLGDFLATAGEHALPDVVATLQHGRTAHRVRAATVAATPAEAVASLRGGASVLRSARPGDPREVVFLFPGQGSQHPRMAAGLYARDRTFAARLDECLELFERHDLPVRGQWSADGNDAELEPTAVAQPLLFSLGYAMAGMWESLGVPAAGLLGHSIGELTAAAVAGVFDLPDAVRLVAARARAMQEAPPGAMLAVAAPAEVVRDLLVDGICMAAVNSRKQTVVAGPAEALTAFASTLAGQGVRSRRARTSHAFHSTAMAPAAARFSEAFEGVVAKPPRIPLYSAATGRRMTDEQATSARFWADQLVEPILFGPALDTVLSGSPTLLLEMGPGRALTSLAKQHPATADGDHLVVPTLPAGPTAAGDEERVVLAAVGQLWTDGHNIDWGALTPEEPVRRIAMPGYQYQRERHWIDVPVEQEPAEPARVADAAAPPPAGAAPQPTAASPFTTVAWAEQPRSGTAARPGTVALVLLPPDRERALDTVAALHEADLRVVPVHPGAAYGETGSGFTARIGEAEDVARVLHTLDARGSLPGLLVHAVTLGAWPAPSQEVAQEQLDSSFHSLHALIQHGGRHRSDGQLPGLLVLSERSADVAGGEPLDPVKATLHGVVRTFAGEQPVTTAKLIDVGSTVDTDELVEEMRHRDRSEIVALRGDRRWVPVERAYPLVPSGRTVLRRDGVYVISGGLGGLGMVVARELAATGMRPRLVLLGRSAVPEDDERLAELTELGARVRPLACDVTNPRALRRAGEIVAAQLGPVNGVLHLAGVAGDGMLQFRGRQDAERVLAPKVLGTLALWELFRDRAPLDFFVCFSSRAAVGGMVGGGDYAAANAFLDAFARSAHPEGGRFVSVNWPAWATVGMAAAGMAAVGMAAAGLAAPSAGGPNGHAVPGPVHAAERAAGDELSWGITLRPETTPALDEHRLDGIPVLPGTGHLDLVVRAFRDRVLGGADRPVRLADVVFQRPLAVPEERRVRIALTPSGEWWRFTVQSQPTTDADAEAQVHVVGRVASADPQPRRIDLTALAERLTERRDPPVREAAGRFFTLGPRWDNVREIRSRPGDRTEQLVHLELPERFAAEAAEHALHPTLLDAATAYARDSRHEPPHLPFMYRSMVVHGPLPARLSSSIRRGEGGPDMIVADVDLVDADGQVLVEIAGFTMRRVKDELPAFAATLRADAPPAGKQAPPAEQPAPPAGQPAPVPPAGIPPQIGGRLFMDLLGARTPRQVAVLPYRNGVPLPLDAAPDAGVPAPGTVGAAPAPAPALSMVTPAPAEPVPVAGGDPVEARLGALWTEALGVVDIAATDDFFDLGGNSLSAVELMSRIQDTFNVELSITALFDYPTLQAFADELRRTGAR